jgi:hypothetical protein
VSNKNKELNKQVSDKKNEETRIALHAIPIVRTLLAMTFTAMRI